MVSYRSYSGEYTNECARYHIKTKAYAETGNTLGFTVAIVKQRNICTKGVTLAVHGLSVTNLLCRKLTCENIVLLLSPSSFSSFQFSILSPLNHNQPVAVLIIM